MIKFQYIQTQNFRPLFCISETKKEPTLSQALHMAVGDTLKDRLSTGGKVKQFMLSQNTTEGIIEEIFIHTLSRRPTREEVESFGELIGDNVTDSAVYEDILWGLLNSTEFMFNH